ncbi:zinc ribbon domain-containing protein (plasmid) [Paraburkholderia megapolitana]|nr:zinc ribbon domain-containing protein [Paraburkholderia megapolitana]
MEPESKVLYVYRCTHCGHRGETHRADDSYDGKPDTCQSCGAAVTLEWDGGVTLTPGAKTPTGQRD